ncbi:MAG TPA: ABC transporter ATP-binding protein [Candidatus Fraserbacteria bacterium]|nr:ABC transporter ATP-binding protein [Candidatus Fraserbacteria bacterium]
MLLQVQDIHTYYGQSHVLQGLSLEVGEREIVSLLGRNGAGKTTTIHSIMGLTPPRAGRILFRGEELSGQPPYQIFRRHIKLVPQGRRIIPSLTVEENLKFALLMVRSDPRRELARIYEQFSVLQERRNQKAGHLSGGERQMLAIGRALLGKPALILMDEPSEGLAPIVVREIMRIITEVNERGVSILLAEQNVKLALETADRHYVIDQGRVRFSGSGEALRAHPKIMESYLGVAARS